LIKETRLYSNEVGEIWEELGESEGKRPRFAIGQDSNGEWLLIAY
jgi:exopolysaccharide biosynthesis protein